MNSTSTAHGEASRALRVAAFGAFFLSGASSLVFQTLWSRLLQHVFGSSSIAISTVVSVFMGGLGLGAYYFGKRADRIRDPLGTYALAELGVGCAGLLIPLLLRPDGFLSTVNAFLRNSLGAGSGLFIVARFACIVPLLIVPTFLMGSTLPLLARHFVRRESSAERASREVGRLYAVNTLGAVVGVFASSFVLLPKLGVSAANLTACCTNFSLAALVLVIRRATPLQQPTPTAGQESQPPVGEPAGVTTAAALPQSLRRAAAAAFAFSGFSSLLYEVVWSRALIDTIGGSLYSFALILATFLIGIALGSAAASSLAHAGTQPRMTLAAACSALVVVASGPLLPQSGVVAYAAVAGLGVCAVLACVALARSRAARDSLFDGAVELDLVERSERRFALAMLAVPVALAAAICVHDADRLTRVSLAVITAIATLLALLRLLRARTIALLIALQLFIAFATFTSELFADRLSLTFAGMVAPLYHELADHVGTVQVIMCVTAALCILPSALAMGAVFPVTLRAWSGGGGDIGRDVGVAYAGNTLGSILGAWLPGFVLMPSLGMQLTLHVGLAANLLVALGLICVAASVLRGDTTLPRSERVLHLAGATLLPALIALLAFASLRPPAFLAWDISKMTLGAFRISLARDVLDEESWGAPDLVYYRDGLSTTVTVERWGRHYSLKNNGKVDASNGDDMPTQIMVAALPLLMHPKPPEQLDVAIIGFGSGVTLGAALQFPLRSTEVVELERSTIEASRFFADVNHLAYVSPHFPFVRMPKLTVWNDDGRNFLAASPRRYDVIVSEPSNPWLTGVSDLFTLDHFRIAKRKLAPDGIYCQWAQLYEISPDNVRTIYRTFAAAFRHVIVFSAEDLSSDTILLGSDSPLPLDLSRLQRAFANPRITAELERAYVHSPFDVFARVLLADRSELETFGANAPINTDDNARIELAAPRDLIGFERYQGYLQTMYAASWRFGHIANNLAGFGSAGEAASHYAQLAMSLLAHGRTREAGTILERVKSQVATPELAIARMVYAALSGHEPEPTPKLLDANAALPDETSAPLRLQLTAAYTDVLAAVDAREWKLAADKLERVPERLRRELGGEWAFLEGYVRFENHDYDDAIDRLEDLVRDRPDASRDHPDLHYFLARAHGALMHFDKAVRNMREYVEARERAGNFLGPPAP